MKYLLLILVFTSVSIAQVDKVYTNHSVYSGKIIGGTWESVYLISERHSNKVIPVKLITRITLASGIDILGEDIPRATYFEYIINIESMKEEPTQAKEIAIIDSLSLQRNQDRTVNAVERIALVQTIQLGLAVGLIVITILLF